MPSHVVYVMWTMLTRDDVDVNTMWTILLVDRRRRWTDVQCRYEMRAEVEMPEKSVAGLRREIVHAVTMLPDWQVPYVATMLIDLEAHRDPGPSVPTVLRFPARRKKSPRRRR